MDGLIEPARNSSRAVDYRWWKHGVIYQIYPRSFADTSGTGSGDLKGIISRLDYLEELGIDGLWISPIFDSPMHDVGYDVRNYRSVHPLFGTLADVDELLKQAHARGIRIILDMVFNHTSSDHRWFVESRSSRTSPKRRWYIWHPGRRAGLSGWRPLRLPPNNWRGAFGGSAWTWDKATEEYYLHLFLDRQPDLNWRNPEVEQAMFDRARFWLDRGVDGFRLDVINYIVKDRALRSNPYHLHWTFPRRHDQQLHMYDRNQPETHNILKRFRKLVDEFGETMLVGEIYPNEGLMEPENSAAYLGSGEDELHLTFDFQLLQSGFHAPSFRAGLQRWYAAMPPDGWPCHFLSNHDRPRAMSRLCKGSVERARLLAALLLTQRGTPFLYYGEEIGMSDGRLRRSHIHDPIGQAYWPIFAGRDPSRTPMQWNGGPNAGFCPPNVKPWLPVNPEACLPDGTAVNVEAQDADPDSLLNWYRKLIRLRRSRAELTHGSIEFLEAHQDVLAYRREHQGSSTTVLLNFSSGSLPFPDSCRRPDRNVAPLGPLEVRMFFDDAGEPRTGLVRPSRRKSRRA
jgi:alpha-glucosidase